MTPEETWAAIKERRRERVSDPHGPDIGDGTTIITVAEGTIRLIPTHSYNGGVGHISDITGTTITVDGLPRDFPFGETVRLDAFAWT